MAELDPLPDDLRALLEAERRREEPADATRDRVLLRLGATVGWEIGRASCRERV